VARCDEFIRTHGLLNRAPALAVGNNLFIVDLNPSIPAYEIPGTGAAAAEAMKQLPAGTICIWDDRQANSWHQLSIDQLPPNNFETLYQTTQWTPGLYSPDKAMRYIVMRKK
jgi:hypothetical protein